MSFDSTFPKLLKTYFVRVCAECEGLPFRLATTFISVVVLTCRSRHARIVRGLPVVGGTLCGVCNVSGTYNEQAKRRRRL